MIGTTGNRLISGVVNGLTPRLPTKTQVSIRPASAGDQPKPSWSRSGTTNGTPFTTAR